ncbi:MAG: hypothetical protein CSA23_02860 [Deltaproteobacteria bacterium]|nr:MAG: hypothetical protein CSA23_02860 [Deltaproteobacteria bacterium]
MKNRRLIHFENLIVVFAVLMAGIMFPQGLLARTDEARTHFTPWSGYWWPTIGGGLANGYGNWTGPAPLEKFELLTDGRYPGDATAWELENQYDPDAESWEGQCHAWAAASAYENIVFYPSSYNNIVFRVGDKKGLLTACHGKDLAISSPAGNPAIFHEWLLNYIKVQRKAFIADLLSEKEVWFFPIYRYSMTLTENYGITGVVCQIWYADDNVKADFQGTREKTHIYTYDLFTNGNGEIVGGQWTGNSTNDHPRSLRFPLTPQASNPYLNCATIRSLASHKDDHLENGETVRLLPGNHNLILLNEDRYTIEGKVGDTVTFHLEKLDDFSEGIDVALRDASGDIVWQATLLKQLDYRLAVSQAPYTMTLSRGDYGGGGIYRLVMDQIRAGQVIVPELQKGSAWNGLTVTNLSSESIDDIQIVAYDNLAQPISTVKDPFLLDPFQKEAWLIETLPMHLHEAPLVRSIKVLADKPPAVFSLGGVQDQTMAGFGQGGQTIQQLVVPDMASLFNVNKQISWGLFNPAPDDISLDLRLYSQQGLLDRQVAKTLSGNTIDRYTSSTNPFNKSLDNGWIHVSVASRGDKSTDEINGFLNWQRDGLGKSESLFALSRIGNHFAVPHIAATYQWQTELSLINLSDQANDVTCRLIDGDFFEQATVQLMPYEKTTVPITDLFPYLDQYTMGRTALLIDSSQDMTGYFAYQTRDSRAIFELMIAQSQSANLSLPHVASDHYWWTGIALFNPMASDTQVILTPMTNEGRQLGAEVVTLDVSAHSKQILMLQSAFNQTTLKSAGWIKIQSLDQEIMGLFLIGDRDMNTISGAELYQ